MTTYEMQGEGILDEEALAYSQRVGNRLRTIRRQKRLSLQEVEAASNQEFKASVLGAYERGERSISVPRLRRLARFYNVPVDQLLPDEPTEIEVGLPRQERMANGSGASRKITLDLTRLRRFEGPGASTIRRYVKTIEVLRQDFNGELLTVRGDDLLVFASALNVPVTRVADHLDELALLHRAIR